MTKLIAVTLRPQQYGHCEWQEEDIADCLRLASINIILASWLSAKARTELSRFKNFIKWLRYGNLFLDELISYLLIYCGQRSQVQIPQLIPIISCSRVTISWK